jgi:hypothetical protein
MLRKDCAQALPPMKCECVVMNRKPKVNCEACIFQRKSTKVSIPEMGLLSRCLFKENPAAAETEAVAPDAFHLDDAPG